MKRLLSLFIMTLTVAACSNKSKPEPAPLVSFKSTMPVSYIWQHSISDGTRELYLNLQPLIYKDTLYAAGHNGVIAAIRLNNGRTIWRQRYAQLPFSSNLGFNNSSLYLGTDKAEAVKISMENGKILWQQTVPSTVLAAPLYHNGHVMVKTIDGQLTALDDKTQTKVWGYQQSLPPLVLRDSSDLVLSGDYTITGFANGTLSSLNTATGQVRWEKEITDPMGKTDVERMVDIDANPILDGNTVYTATYQGQLAAVNISSGDIIWKHDVSIFNNLTTDKHHVYATDEQGFVWAFDKESGQVLWHQENLKNRELSPPAVVNDTVAVADAQGYLHFMDTSDGHFKARVKVSHAGIRATPMVVQNRLILYTINGDLFAYQVGDSA